MNASTFSRRAQVYADGALQYQDEDVDYDGGVDRRFAGDQLVDHPAGTRVPAEAFGKLSCGRFHRFWSKR